LARYLAAHHVIPGNKGASIKRIKIAADGSFSGERSCRRVIEGGRSGGGSDWDVYDRSPSQGEVHRLQQGIGDAVRVLSSLSPRYRTVEISDEAGIPRYAYCKTGRTTWNAKSRD
jgi:hypothetical protein